MHGPWRTLLYEVLWRCSGRFEQAANAFAYLAGGLLRRGDLRRQSETAWGEFNASDDGADAGLDPWEQRLYGQNLQMGDRVLIVGCGTGRDLIALRRQGYAVTGLDQSPSIVDQARAHLTRRGLDAELVAAPIESAELRGPYDVVILSNLCYSCIQGAAQRITALERIREHLTPAGRVLMSYLCYPRRPPLGWRLAAAMASLARGDWRPEPGDLFVRHDRSRRLLVFQHSYLPEEVVQECAAAGLRVVRDYAEANSLRCAVSVASESSRILSQTAGSSSIRRG